MYCKVHLLKYTIQWLLIYSQISATITIVNIRTFSLSQKETLYSLTIPTLSNHLSIFCFYRFPYSKHFAWMETYNYGPFFFFFWCAQSCPTLCDPMDRSLPRLLCSWDFPSKSTGVGCHFLLQGNGSSCDRKRKWKWKSLSLSDCL